MLKRETQTNVLLYHVVFTTKDRFQLISPSWENELYRYLGGIVKNHGGEAIEINGMPEHAHVLARLKPLSSLPDFMRELKASSSKWAKQHHPKFAWQRRYAAIPVSESMSHVVRQYIRNQKRHHQKQTFEDEFVDLLRLHNVRPEISLGLITRVAHATSFDFKPVYRLRYAPPVAKVIIACAAR